MGIFDAIMNTKDDNTSKEMFGAPAGGIISIFARKRPIQNVFVEVKTGNKYPDYVKLQRDASKDLQLQVWNELHKSWVGISEGDMLCITNQDDIYPVVKADFEKTYVVDEGGVNGN